MSQTLQYLIVAMLVVAILVLVLPNYLHKNEMFVDYTNLTIDNYSNASRDTYFEIGRRRYNPYADTKDVLRPGSMATRVTDDQLAGVLDTVDLTPSPDTKTYLKPTSTYRSERPPPDSALLKSAQKCEAKKTRDACSILSDPNYKECGVCIKGGTDYAGQNEGKHIGGLLVLPMDREEAEDLAKTSGGDPQYQATLGSCPPGYLHVNRAVCEREVNRLNCKEAGESGGFVGGKTIEGKSVVPTSCANCYSAGSSVFVYEPKPRTFKPRIRIITPTGTGVTTIRISTSTGALITEERLEPGRETLILVNRDLKEGDELQFRVVQEFPHRPRGRKEVFQIDTGKAVDTTTASILCKSIDTDVATQAQLTESWVKGAQLCKAGQGSDFVGWPSQAVDKNGKCGTAKPVNPPTAATSPEVNAAWCYGIKPAPGTYGTKSVGKFFNSYGAGSTPPQDEQPDIPSEFGIDYEAPAYRGIVIQWEADSIRRRLAFEPTITTVMGMAPATTTSDGFNLFKLLRRYGTFSQSLMIVTPKPSSSSNMLSSQYWLWSNQVKNPEFIFTAKIPGVLTDPYYIQDLAVCPRGPLIGQQSTFDLLKVSPCDKPDQKPGSYNIDCLSSLFRGAGGDIVLGELSPKNSTANQRTLMFDESGTARSTDAILAYLGNLYSIASKGRDSDGNLVGGNNKDTRRTMINAAAKALFGRELVTPCEDIVEDAAGTIMVVKKTGPFDASCLDYLFLNAGTHKDRGYEGARGTTIKATYESIGDRFSGLKSTDFGASTENLERFPFQTCQRSGTLAPVTSDGRTNTSAVFIANSQGTTIDEVQNFYNRLYKDANRSFGENDTVTKDALTAKTESIRRCFGLERAADPVAMGCGVPARYVRIMRPDVGIQNDQWECPTTRGQLQISQIQVFDSQGVNNALGKPVTTRSGTNGAIAVDGVTTPRGVGSIYMDEGAAEDNSQFWMVDLGTMKEVNEVVYINRANNSDSQKCLKNAIHMIVQLLDNNKNVIAQKTFSTKAIEKDSVTFKKEDTELPIPLGLLKPGIRVAIECASQTNLFLVGGDGERGYFTTIQTPELYDKIDYTWTIRPSVEGKEGTLSFQSNRTYGRPAGQRDYMIHDYNGDWAVYVTGCSLVGGCNTASWIPRPALNGAPGWISLESAFRPGYFLTSAKGWGFKPYVRHRNTLTTDSDLVRACLRIHRV